MYAQIYNQPAESVFVLYVDINSGLATVHWLTNKETYLWEGLILVPTVISCLWLLVYGWAPGHFIPPMSAYPLILHCSCLVEPAISRRYCSTADFLVF